MSKSQEYKCPKCFCWNEVSPIKPIDNKTMECVCCGYIGDFNEFKAKSYQCYIQLIVRVIAFDEEDAKREFEQLKEEDFETYFDKLIKIMED